MPLALPDYPGYGIRPDSVFYAGGPEEASDLNSMGQISFLSTRPKPRFNICQTACGSPGPFPGQLADLKIRNPIPYSASFPGAEAGMNSNQNVIRNE